MAEDATGRSPEVTDLDHKFNDCGQAIQTLEVSHENLKCQAAAQKKVISDLQNELLDTKIKLKRTTDSWMNEVKEYHETMSHQQNEITALRCQLEKSHQKFEHEAQLIRALCDSHFSSNPKPARAQQSKDLIQKEKAAADQPIPAEKKIATDEEIAGDKGEVGADGIVQGMPAADETVAEILPGSDQKMPSDEKAEKGIEPEDKGKICAATEVTSSELWSPLSDPEEWVSAGSSGSPPSSP